MRLSEIEQSGEERRAKALRHNAATAKRWADQAKQRADLAAEQARTARNKQADRNKRVK